MRSAAVIGAGWAGLAAAVRLQAAGWAVTLFESASSPGGRARSVSQRGQTFDNGQHILIGAYSQTLALMQQVGVDPRTVLHRGPLDLRDASGRGLRLPAWPPPAALLWATLRLSHWPWTARGAWMVRAARWALRGMDCAPSMTVADLCHGLPASVMDDLVDPLCVAALNTPSAEASGRVFLRVLKDAMFSGKGSADLLLPRVPLGELFPAPALAWLARRGAQVRWRHRVQELAVTPSGWRVDGNDFNAVLLACSAPEAARLTQTHAPAWSAAASALRYEPIITLVLEAGKDTQLGAPMVRLSRGPAQFAFDLRAIGHSSAGGGPPDVSQRRRFTAVISAAAPWLQAATASLEEATLAQMRRDCPGLSHAQDISVVARFTEKRATFRCTTGLQRPPGLVDGRLFAAGDYVEGPYPATLEGAVRSGLSAAERAIAS